MRFIRRKTVGCGSAMNPKLEPDSDENKPTRISETQLQLTTYQNYIVRLPWKHNSNFSQWAGRIEEHFYDHLWQSNTDDA